MNVFVPQATDVVPQPLPSSGGWHCSHVRLMTVLLALVSSAPVVTAAQEGRAWRPEDRVVLTSFHLVSGMTRDERRLYAASEGGLQMLDLFTERWEMPSTEEDGYPVTEGPTAVTFDPIARVVWLGTAAGTLHTFQVDFRRWRLEATPGVGPVLALVPFAEGLDDGVVMRTPTGWYRVVRSSGWADPVSPNQLPDQARLAGLDAAARLARLEPSFAAAGPTLTADDAGRRWPLTDFVIGDRPSQYWLGTAGNNLYLYDARRFETIHRTFGLLTPGAGALGAEEGALWIGGDGRGPRRGLVRASADLQQWTQFESGIVPVPRERVDDVLVTPDAVWFASASGLYRYDPASGAWTQVGGTIGRLPVRRLARSAQGLWAATDRGLVRVSDRGTLEGTLFQGRAVHAVLEVGRTVWVGGAWGLVRADLDGRVLAPDPAATPPPPGPIVDIVMANGDVWAATVDALWRFDGRDWEGPLREVPSILGRIHRLRVTGDALWATGDGGAARMMADQSAWHYLLLDRDLPAGPAFDVLATETHVHVSTPAGLVQLERRRGY